VFRWKEQFVHALFTFASQVNHEKIPTKEGYIMAVGKRIGEFSLKATTITLTPGPAGSVLLQANYEGTGTGFGTVLGTLSAASAGQKSGTWSWCAAAYLDNGDSVTGTGQGIFQSDKPNRWRTQGGIQLSDGRMIILEGEIDLATRSWTGQLFEKN
jgi:hypothetical protein